MEIEKPCMLCGRKFVSSRIDAMYCCKACKQAAYRISKARKIGNVYAEVRVMPRPGDVR